MTVKVYGNERRNDFLKSVTGKIIIAQPNLVRIQVEIISDPNYLVRILFER